MKGTFEYMRNPGFIFPVLLSLAVTGVAAGEKLYVPELSRQVQRDRTGTLPRRTA